MRWWYLFVIGAAVLVWVVYDFFSTRNAGRRHQSKMTSLEDDGREAAREAREQSTYSTRSSPLDRRE